ncbi:MAG TPA: sigma-70 family RNA polymerase sigma factor [Gaiella sp.]|nr:sigma-70 family RNA polymerase sigma factor [Gaiella sp.]
MLGQLGVLARVPDGPLPSLELVQLNAHAEPPSDTSLLSRRATSALQKSAPHVTLEHIRESRKHRTTTENGVDTSVTAIATGEEELVRALRGRDERAVAELVDRYGSAMVRLARIYVDEQPVAEEVAQEAWISVLRGIDRFEGRSSLKTWIFRILVNTAKTRARRERRTVSFSALDSDGPAVEADRFLPDRDAWAGHWSQPPRPVAPEDELLAGEVRRQLADAIRALPPAQRAVIGLRDVEGWSAEEVCDLLDLTAVHQRVLLHRARSAVRRRLEPYLEEAQA